VIAKLVNDELQWRRVNEGPTMPPAARRRPPAPGRAGSIDEMKSHAADAARLMKALGNEQRLLVLCNLLERPMTVGELNARMDLSQSALSQHLALLREAGLVETRREAQSIHYSLPSGPVTRVMGLLQDIYCAPEPPGGRAAASRGSRSSCTG
jgi:ArsR family transcriptional regulator, virulence genes transcriptional regulator